jgi:hypothetical protein
MPIDDNLRWVAPNSGELTTLIEFQSNGPIIPVYIADFICVKGTDSNGDGIPVPIYYEHLSGIIPHYFKLIQTGTNLGHLHIIPLVRELDQYILPEYAKPNGFSYDTADTAGGNYASYGSGLSGGKSLSFTIRAWDATDLDTFVDSNGETQYVIDTNTSLADYVDRTFSIFVENNYSSDRDGFFSEYFDGQSFSYGTQTGLTFEEFLVLVKADGYYI